MGSQPRHSTGRRAGLRSVRAPTTTTGNSKSHIADEIRRLQKTRSLLIAVQFAANHEAEFDVGDALAVIVALVHESIAGLDRVEAAS